MATDRLLRPQAELLVNTGALAPYFRASFDYAKTLKPKATKRAPKS